MVEDDAPDRGAPEAPLLGRAICPRCRRLAPTTRPCDGDGAPLLDLASPEGRARFVDAIWGSSMHRAALAEHGRPGTVTVADRVASASVTAAISGGVAYAIAGPVPAAAMAIFGGLAGVVGARTRGRLLIPSGAEALAEPETFAVGRIVSVDSLVAPGSGTTCSAWAIELHFDGSWGRRTTLRAGTSAGIDIVLDGGEHARIPAGPLWIAGRLTQVDGEESTIDECLAALDPPRSAIPEPWPLFPYNVLVEATLHHADRVALLGAFEREPLGLAANGLYRDDVPTVLVPRSIPTLRLA